MKVITPYSEIVAMEDEETILRQIEAAGRTCYKSEGKITKKSAVPFIKKF